MADEQGYRREQSNSMCANNCGFFGNPTTLNLCSKCYQSQTTTTTAPKTASSHPIFSFLTVPAQDGVVSSTADNNTTASSSTPCGPSRCGACRKRVGLTGFECRCGAMYCGTHRYPEMHSCTFDFKTAGKEAIKKANPVIKAAKLENRL